MRAIFFDLDDTLCSTSSTRLARAQLAFDLLTDAGHAVEWEPFLEGILRIDPGATFIRGLQPVLEDLGIAQTPEGERAARLWFFDGCSYLIEPFDGALDVLDRLARDFVLGVITNGPTEIQRRKFDALLCDGHFHPDLFITSEIAGCYKPDPAIFQLALQRAGIDPRDAVHIGDVPEIDVAGAQSAGMRGVWFDHAARPLPETIVPDATVSSFSQIASLMETWRA